jgi:hypothetical protein
MTRAHRQNTPSDPLPSIIIHPSLYKPERHFWLQRVCEGFMELTRIAVVVTLVGTATAGVAHVIERRALPAHETIRVVPADCTQVAPAPAITATASEAIVSSPPPVGASPSVLAASDDARPRVAAPLSKPARRVFDVADSVRYARRMFALNRLEEAELAYRRVLAASDRQLAALVGLSRVLLARGQHAEAEALAERAVAQAPDQAASQLALGDALRARGESEASEAHYLLATFASTRATRASAPPALEPL